MFGFTNDFALASQAGAFLLGLGDAGCKICVVFLLAAGAAHLLRRSSASMRHLVWSVAMASFILTPILSAWVPKWRILPSWSSMFDRSGPDVTQRQIDGLPTPPIEPEVGTPESPGDTNPTVSAVKLDAQLPSRSAATSHSVLPRLSSIACAVWLSGCCFILLRTALSRIVLLRISRSAVPVRSGPIRDAIEEILGKFEIRRRVDAFLSDRRGTPMTWGLMRAHLLLPSGASDWDLSRLRAVLLHELAHVKRRDTVIHVFAQLVLAIFWFHPLVWVAARRLREECEFACDDLVLRSGVKASNYAEILLGILVPRSVPGPALAMAGQSDLEGRLRAILEEELDRRSISRGIMIAATVVALLSTASVASLQTSNRRAQEENEQSPSVPVAPAKAQEKVVVSCVDSDGKPISGAEVFLFQFTGPSESGRYVQTGPFTTDGAGRAECSEVTLYDGNKYDRWFYARVPGSLVGAGRSAKWMNRVAFNTEGRVVLQPSRVVDGRVIVPDGFDPTKVTVSLRTMQVNSGAGLYYYESFTREEHFPGLDTALPGLFECRPDAEGRIRFSDVPERGRIYLVSKGSGLAEAQWSNYRNKDALFPDPIFLDVREESLLTGRVLSPDGKPAAGMKVTARLSATGRRENAHLSSFHAISDDEGRFALHGLPATEFDLSVTDPMKRWSFRPKEDLLVDPGQDPVMVLNMEASVRVSGVVTGPDGKPVGGAAISAVADDQGGPGLAGDQTDADGHYELRLPSGEACLYFNSLPDGFEYPKPQIAKRLQIKSSAGEIKNIDFTLERKAK